MFEIVYQPAFGERNELGQPKPFFETYETPLRCKLTWEHLKQIGFTPGDFEASGIQRNDEKNLAFKRPAALKKEDILLVHTPYHYEMVEKFSRFGCGQLGNSVLATEDSLDLALLSAGGAYEAINDVITGGHDQSFALIRPPGHHAMSETPDGLCIFNNIAVAISKIRKEQEFSGKLAIIDIDAHYGNGLARIFAHDPNVLYSSIHEMDFSIGEEGFFTEIGLGAGEGYNICFPVRYGSGDKMLQQYCTFLEPFVRDFSPDMIIIAAGFDGHWADPLGNLKYTSHGYQEFTRWVKKISHDVCSGRVSFCLEGGYNLIMVPRLIETIISEFIGVPKTKFIDDYPQDIINRTTYSDELFASRHKDKIDALKKKLRKIWG